MSTSFHHFEYTATSITIKSIDNQDKAMMVPGSNTITRLVRCNVAARPLARSSNLVAVSDPSSTKYLEQPPSLMPAKQEQNK
jgi:hypothetical protein